MTNNKKKWYMVTLVGKDKTSIVSHVTAAIYDAGGNLGETSMMRLGGNFTIMMMVEFAGSRKNLEDALNTVTDSMELHIHIDKIDAKLHEHIIPDVRISVYGADRAGIVSKVTTVLAEAGLNILDLESDVAGDINKPLYIMHIEGSASEGIKPLESALNIIKEEDGVDVELVEIDTMVG
ncbi:MAG: ACT domain-containing protein [Woeseiaceae bacterium]